MKQKNRHDVIPSPDSIGTRNLVVGSPPHQMLHFVQHDNTNLALCIESLTQDASPVDTPA
ncbi:MAG: hypothetical protein ABID84_02040 [Chloroflexota bacterium]